MASRPSCWFRRAAWFRVSKVAVAMLPPIQVIEGRVPDVHSGLDLLKSRVVHPAAASPTLEEGEGEDDEEQDERDRRGVAVVRRANLAIENLEQVDSRGSGRVEGATFGLPDGVVHRDDVGERLEGAD